MRIVSPTPNQVFEIASDTTAPAIEVVTDGQGPHHWSWTVSWRTFRQNHTGNTAGNRVSFQPLLTDLGGDLMITATAGGQQASIHLKIVGTNPSLTELRDFTRPLPQGSDLLLILEHETHGRQFNDRGVNQGQPIVSFDHGYGMAQLTTPRPSYQQCWSWKQNVRGGIALFATKRVAAIAYLSQGGRTYTPEQLQRETICRWNGGAYHVWNGTAWQRPDNIVCAPGTGNIGWDMNDPENAGKTVAELQGRDREDYRHPHTRDDHWRYLGVCYVDSLLGS